MGGLQGPEPFSVCIKAWSISSSLLPLMLPMTKLRASGYWKADLPQVQARETLPKDVLTVQM